MEMTLSFLAGDKKSALIGIILPLGILILIAMMVLPLPSFLLDIFFMSNILLSLIILLVAINTYRPLDFSSFPALLLIATVLRLGLNVASTRVVLTAGHEGTDAAGHVIEAFGNFVISGNYAVGIFVFIILIIINLVVITRGAGRVSEVSARFTLDAMPGKQMAIDADLNAGILTNEEATQRRQDIANEADFYGAMDGASKFVKGDAVASILILVINIIGGLTIGLLQHQMAIEQAAENYILLSIGDGLVAQIPSLLLSIATAIIVTRVSSTQNMAEHIGKQISLKRAWLPAAGVMLLIGFIPGMPNILFLIAALIASAIGLSIRDPNYDLQSNDELAEPEAEDKTPDAISLAEIAENAPISVQLGYALVSMVDEDAGGPLINRITGIRRQVSKTLGFVIPTIRIRDDAALDAHQYRIRIGQTIVGEDKVYPDRKLAIPGDESSLKLDGIEAKDPSFGIDAIWITPNQTSEAELNHYTVVAPESVLATHINQILYAHAYELIGQDDVQNLLDNLAEQAPQLVQSVVPSLVPLHDLTAILRLLLEERVPIGDLRRILEELANMTGRDLSITARAEALRPFLANLLLQQIAPLNEPLLAITLSSALEQMLIAMARQNPDGNLILEPQLTERLITTISEVTEQLSIENKTAILIVAPNIRRHLAQLLHTHLQDLIVLAFTELADKRKVDIVMTIGEEGETS